MSCNSYNHLSNMGKTLIYAECTNLIMTTPADHNHCTTTNSIAVNASLHAYTITILQQKQKYAHISSTTSLVPNTVFFTNAT